MFGIYCQKVPDLMQTALTGPSAVYGMPSLPRESVVTHCALISKSIKRACTSEQNAVAALQQHRCNSKSGYGLCSPQNTSLFKSAVTLARGGKSCYNPALATEAATSSARFAAHAGA